jgi:hypothetical protein
MQVRKLTIALSESDRQGTFGYLSWANPETLSAICRVCNHPMSAQHSKQFNSRWKLFSQDLRDFQSENKRFVVGAATSQWFTQLKTVSGQGSLKKHSIWTQRTNEHRVFAHQRLKHKFQLSGLLNTRRNSDLNTKNTREKLFETQDLRPKEHKIRNTGDLA